MLCPRKFYKILSNYFVDRTAGVYTENTSVIIPVTRGCPQGSCSGPVLWNLMYNSLLNMQNKLPGDSLIQGYADDTVILVRHRNRDILEKLANEAILLVSNWSDSMKLNINVKLKDN